MAAAASMRMANAGTTQTWVGRSRLRAVDALAGGHARRHVVRATDLRSMRAWRKPSPGATPVRASEGNAPPTTATMAPTPTATQPAAPSKSSACDGGAAVDEPPRGRRGQALAIAERHLALAAASWVRRPQRRDESPGVPTVALGHAYCGFGGPTSVRRGDGPCICRRLVVEDQKWREADRTSKRTDAGAHAACETAWRRLFGDWARLWMTPRAVKSDDAAVRDLWMALDRVAVERSYPDASHIGGPDASPAKDDAMLASDDVCARYSVAPDDHRDYVSTEYREDEGAVRNEDKGRRWPVIMRGSAARFVVGGVKLCERCFYNWNELRQDCGGASK
jgi:hypothetical protein